MSVHHHKLPIVTDGLELQIDAANKLGGNITNTKNIAAPLEIGTFVNGLTVVNGEFDFDGVDDYLSFGGSVKDGITTDLTLSVWVKLDSLTTAYLLHDYLPPTSTTANINWAFVASPDRFQYRNTGNAIGTGILTSSPVLSDTWYNVVIAVSGANTAIYLNGNLEDSANDNANLNTSNATTLYVGRASGGGLNLNGKMSSVKIYNRELTATEISQNYEATKHNFE